MLKRRRNYNLIKIASAALCLIIAFTAATFGWFSRYNTIDFPNAYGGTAKAAYFAGGDGSKNDPYKIKTAVHLYNFAWLQYLGYFNLNPTLNNGRAQSYFELDDNVDMSVLNSALPPIGTAQYPFIGGFNGANYSIYNLTVSNQKSDLTVRPLNAHIADSSAANAGRLLAATQNGEVSVVGLFGVVGDYNAFIADNYKGKSVAGAEIVINDSSTDFPADYSQIAVNEFYHKGMYVKNFYVDKVHVKSYSKKTLLGLAAGYVNAAMQNVGVYRCDASFAAGATGLTDDYGTIVSKYSLIGDYNKTAVSWGEDPTAGSTGGDSDGGWGGSIDMRTLNRRISYMIAKVGVKSNSGTTAKNSGFGIDTYRTSNGEFKWNDRSTTYMVLNLNQDTVLPINVNKTDMGLTNDDTTEYESGNGFHYNAYYRDNATESVDAKNTGYIVGGSSKQGDIRTRIQPLISGTGPKEAGVYKSLCHDTYKLTSAADALEMYDKTKFEMLTVTMDGTTYRIKDDTNTAVTATTTGFKNDGYNQIYYSDAILGFKKGYDSKKKKTRYIYEIVRDDFDEDMYESYMVHGFHFMPKISSGDYTVKQAAAKIYGKTKTMEEYVKYQFVSGGLNFTVAEAGSIRTILGTFYGNGTAANSIFDLYYVDRSVTTSGTGGKNATINTVTHVKEIYKDSGGNIIYNPEDTTGLTQVFSFGSALYSLPHGAAYYFEIPVAAGDYVIGAQKADSSAGESVNNNTAYLMYLDIGANGDDGGDDPSPGDKKDYYMTGVDFVNTPSVTPAADGSYPAFKDVTVALLDVSETEAAQTIYMRNNNGLTDSSGQIADTLRYKYKNITAVVSPNELGDDKSDDDTFVPSTDTD